MLSVHRRHLLQEPVPELPSELPVLPEPVLLQEPEPLQELLPELRMERRPLLLLQLRKSVRLR